jgi:hypothetical protein
MSWLKPLKELNLEEVQAALDAAGIVDPTPASDLASAALSASRGDWLGCGLSLISVVPYIGDAVAKPVKGAKAAARLTKLADRLAGLKALRNKALAARKKAADRVRELREKAKRAKLDEVKQNCPKVNPFGTRTPATGRWFGQKGNSTWTPGKNTRNRRKIEKITGGKPIPFRKGYPDFSPYTYKGPPGKGAVKIHMTGDNTADFAAANKAAGFDRTPKGFTWHHHQDGTTMRLIPSDLHNNVSHTGGASIISDKRY